MDGARTVAKHSQNPSVLHVSYVLPQRIVGGGYGEKKNGMGDPLTSDHGRQHLCGSKMVSRHSYVVTLYFLSSNEDVNGCKPTVRESVNVSLYEVLDIPEEACRKDHQRYDANHDAPDGSSGKRGL